MVDKRLISFYLDLKIKRDYENNILKLSLIIYIKKILVKYHLNKTKHSNSPIKKVILLLNKGLEATNINKKEYRGMTRLLIFSIVKRNSDIVFATSVVRYFIKNPS